MGRGKNEERERERERGREERREEKRREEEHQGTNPRTRKTRDGPREEDKRPTAGETLETERKGLKMSDR